MFVMVQSSRRVTIDGRSINVAKLAYESSCVAREPREYNCPSCQMYRELKIRSTLASSRSSVQRLSRVVSFRDVISTQNLRPANYVHPVAAIVRQKEGASLHKLTCANWSFVRLDERMG